MIAAHLCVGLTAKCLVLHPGMQSAVQALLSGSFSACLLWRKERCPLMRQVIHYGMKQTD